jgi:integrase
METVFPRTNLEVQPLFALQAKEEGFRELILLGLATGMRRGELLGLKWDDINFTTGE